MQPSNLISRVGYERFFLYCRTFQRWPVGLYLGSVRALKTNKHKKTYETIEV